MVSGLMAAAAQAGCYKVMLDCDVSNQAFYEKLGLEHKGSQMVSASSMPCWTLLVEAH